LQLKKQKKKKSVRLSERLEKPIERAFWWSMKTAMKIVKTKVQKAAILLAIL